MSLHLHHDKEAFAELMIGAAKELVIPTNVIEKDYYVTITLKALAEKTSDLVFKGGTSFTKCYQFNQELIIFYHVMRKNYIWNIKQANMKRVNMKIVLMNNYD